MLLPRSEGTSAGTTPGIIHKTALPNPLELRLQVERLLKPTDSLVVCTVFQTPVAVAL